MFYRHTQWGYIAIPLIPFLVVVMVPLVLADEEVPSAFIALMAVVMVAVALVVVYFSRLEVVVDSEHVTAAFGLGKPHRVIALREVASVRRIRNQWWYGFGVRRLSSGWMYNVWGLDGVEIEAPEGRFFTIGTDDPDDLIAVLRTLSRA